MNAREIWLRKIEHLREEEAKCSDPIQKFAIRASIREAEETLRQNDERLSSPVEFASGTRVSPTHLRHTAEKLIGRNAELRRLDEAWADARTHVVVIRAWGGVGKTALIADWMTLLAADEIAPWRGARFVFDWSFYSHGTRRKEEVTSRAASADLFLVQALAFFGDPDPQFGSPWDRGVRLARLVGQSTHANLLVLDGLEPLQHPPGPLGGRLTDPGIEALLKGLAQQNSGLCVVTTREKVADLANFYGRTAQDWALEHLSDEAGAELLHWAGANCAGPAAIKSDDAELRVASSEVRGHALTLHLMGRYLALAHAGDIRKRDLFEFTEADAEVEGGHAFRVLAAYEHWLRSGGEQTRVHEGAKKEAAREGDRILAALQLMGLFDGPADPGCLHELRDRPAIVGLTDALVGTSDAQWNTAVKRLEEIGLLTRVPFEPPRTRGYTKQIAQQALMLGMGVLPEPATFDPSRMTHGYALEAHPLVREYFAKRLCRDADTWKAANRRLFEHLQRRVPYWPEDLVDLQPLYRAVVHGCHAGLHEQALHDVYQNRILRVRESYSTFKLGAIGADLSAMACFFDRPWNCVSSNLSDDDQAWLLNKAVLCLRAIGRLTEALDPMRQAINWAVENERWTEAAIGAINLSALELRLGEVSAAVVDGKRSLAIADRHATDWHRYIISRTTCADALHHSGRRDEAERLFREAEAMQAQRQPCYPRLYSLRGFQYCDLLLSAAERAAWQSILKRGDLSPPRPSRACARITSADGECQSGDKSRYSIACAEVAERAEGSQRAWREVFADRPSLLDVALDHLALARAGLCGALLAESASAHLESEVGNPESRFEAARRDIAAAVDGLRQASQLDHLPCGLLTLSWFRFVEGDRPDCEDALAEAWEIAARGPMPLYQADIQLTRARLFRDRAALVEARRLIDKHGYHRRDEELADAEEAARSWP